MVSAKRFYKITLEIAQECNRQDEKWGANRNHDPFIWFAILVEEVGELAKATLQNYFDGSERKNLREEAIHVAAVAIQIIDYLDRDTQVRSNEQ